MSKQVIDLDDFQGIDVPTEIAVCPYCNGQIRVEEIEQHIALYDGTIQPHVLKLKCLADAAHKTPEWNIWPSFQIPASSAHWSPVSGLVRPWLTENFEWPLLEGGDQ